MPRNPYCLPIDVTRRFDPTITQSGLSSNNYIGAEDRETIRSRIDGVENQFEDDTNTALREVRVGSVGAPGTYEYLESKRSFQFPTQYTLDNNNVIPLDASEGDAIEVRTARDNWRDITPDEGSRWTLVEPRQGKLEFYSRLRHTVQFRVRPGVRFIRLTYRYGALGGSPTEGGQTTIQASLSGTSTPTGLSVGDASRLPNGGGVMLLGGAEYVRVTNVDSANDTVDIAERGLRRTDETTSHISGDVLHYCPMRVREGIAALACVELAQIENFVDQLITSDATLSLSEKTDEWKSEYSNTVARFSGWGHS